MRAERPTVLVVAPRSVMAIVKGAGGRGSVKVVMISTLQCLSSVHSL